MNKKQFYDMIEQHYRDNHSALVKRIRGGTINHHDAEDIVQETYTRALQYWKSFDGGNLEGWFTTILQNCINSQQRANRDRGMSREEPSVVAESDPHTKLELKQIVEYIDAITDADKRLVARSFLLLGYKYKELSQITLHSPTVLRKMIQRIREDLKDAYQEV